MKDNLEKKSNEVVNILFNNKNKNLSFFIFYFLIIYCLLFFYNA
jgi:hypothetical protein